MSGLETSLKDKLLLIILCADFIDVIDCSESDKYRLALYGELITSEAEDKAGVHCIEIKQPNELEVLHIQDVENFITEVVSGSASSWNKWRGRIIATNITFP